jgi:hypothetical protein
MEDLPATRGDSNSGTSNNVGGMVLREKKTGQANNY